MYRILVNTCLLIVALTSIIGSWPSVDDTSQYYLKPADLYGSWDRIIMTKSRDYPDTYSKSVIIYDIRELNADEHRVFSAILNNGVVEKPLLFIAKYKIGYIKGYIYDPEVDLDSMSVLRYKAVLDLGDRYQYSTISFKMPKRDWLWVNIGIEFFELEKRK